MDTPNVYADQIEWMCTHFKDRERVIVGVHPHNDRGTCTAAELSLLAGADRLEGTLLGNGERTGNLDILNVTYNMFAQGVNPKLNIENIQKIIAVYDWEVSYLLIDPSDIGREYEALVRINSQSGKGGIAYVMEKYFGYTMPKSMHKEFADVIQKLSEEVGEIPPQTIMDKFKEEYLENEGIFKLVKCNVSELPESAYSNSDTIVNVGLIYKGKEMKLTGAGNGPISSLNNASLADTTVLGYSEHFLGDGSEANAAAYIRLKRNDMLL